MMLNLSMAYMLFTHTFANIQHYVFHGTCTDTWGRRREMTGITRRNSITLERLLFTNSTTAAFSMKSCEVLTTHCRQKQPRNASSRGSVETDFFQNIICLVKAHYHV